MNQSFKSFISRTTDTLGLSPSDVVLAASEVFLNCGLEISPSDFLEKFQIMGDQVLRTQYPWEFFRTPINKTVVKRNIDPWILVLRVRMCMRQGFRIYEGSRPMPLRYWMEVAIYTVGRGFTRQWVNHTGLCS